MPSRGKEKYTLAYPLRRSGCFTWNKKYRRIVFMRIADPEAENPELHYMSQFILDGDDIKRLYQVLHHHFRMAAPHRPTEFHDDLPNPGKRIKSDTRKGGPRYVVT